MKLHTILTLAVFILTPSYPANEHEKEYDLVIYGPTSAAVAAAVQAKRMDKTVLIVGPDKHLGGLTAGGLGWSDSGNKAVTGHLSYPVRHAAHPKTGCRKRYRWSAPTNWQCRRRPARPFVF